MIGYTDPRPTLSLQYQRALTQQQQDGVTSCEGAGVTTACLCAAKEHSAIAFAQRRTEGRVSAVAHDSD